MNEASDFISHSSKSNGVRKATPPRNRELVVLIVILKNKSTTLWRS